MQVKITGQEPFQVLSTNFSISPSESGYDLMFSADGFEYSKLFTVGADTNRQVTQVAAGSYYFLSGNTGEVTINWMKDCGGQGGGGSYVLPVASENTLGGVKIGSGIAIDENGAISAEGGGGGYVLPVASENTLGGVKIGSGLTIDSGGTVSAEGGSYVLPVASANVLGGVKIGSGITIDENGAISAEGGGTQYAAGDGIEISGSTISVKAGEGLSFSGDTLIATGGSYVLPVASDNTLGGVKIGSGLTMDDNDKLNVAIGDGLAFSGNTIVATGGGGGGKETIIINDLDSAGLAALATRLFGYYDSEDGTIDFPVDELELYWYVPDPNYAGGYDDNGYKDYVKVMPVNVQETEWEQNGMWLSGPFSLGSFDGGNLLRNFRIMILEDGSLFGAGVDAVPVPQEISYSWVRFGNDERGELTYDADNDCFYYDNNTIATGDTTNVYEDLIDNLMTDSMFEGGLIFGSIFPVNYFRMYVTENGETKVYTHPVLSKKTFETPVTIDSQDFYKEVTFNYGDWKFTALYGADDGNNAANLRIAQAYIV